MRNLKLYLYAAVGIIIAGLIVYINVLKSKNSELKENYQNSLNNVEAYALENSSLKDQNRVYLYTIDQLNNNKDSLVQKIASLKKEMQLKDKNITNLSYLLSENSKKDTIVFRDTLFVENTKVDTLIVDDWSKVHLTLDYPNVITTNVSFKNEVLIVTHVEKETVNKPFKCALFRFFQKKRDVIYVDVKEQNPYCETKEQKFINIVE